MSDVEEVIDPEVIKELLYNRPESGRRRMTPFGYDERRSYDSLAKDQALNIELKEARAALKDALKNPENYSEAGLEWNAGGKRVESIEDKREIYKSGRADTESTHSRSGLDRRARKRRMDDPSPKHSLRKGPTFEFGGARSINPETVIGGRRPGDPQWLNPLFKKPTKVEKRALQDLIGMPVIRTLARGSMPVVQLGFIADALAGGDISPVDAEIAGDPAPGGDLAMEAAERRGESMFNLAEEKRRLMQALGKNGAY